MTTLADAHLPLMRRGLFQSRRGYLHTLVTAIRKLSGCLQAESEASLRNRVDVLRDNLATTRFTGLHRDELAAAGSLVVEAIRRTLNVRLYDVQILAGLGMAHGAIAEMQTGEGKTLSAILPAFLHGLRSGTVHVVTANQYLADRDFRHTQPVFEILGLRSSVLPDQDDSAAKQAAYDCDITYGAGYEFGFDYLRDQLALDRAQHAPLGEQLIRRLTSPSIHDRPMQRRLAIALIDEIDHVLIDDACSPLVLSDAAPNRAPDTNVCRLAHSLAVRMELGVDLLSTPQEAAIQLTPAGRKRVDACYPEVLQDQLIRPWREYVEQALVAQYVLKRDVHYVVRNEEVQIIDVSTGRIFDNRFWNRGLHQAAQVKEGLPVTGMPKSLAQICRQRFFRQYDTLCGMTGTARECQSEFSRVYGLSIDRIPLRRPSQRVVGPTRIFQDRSAKWHAIAVSAAQKHTQGQPVLVGTRCIADSRELAYALTVLGCSFQLLNGLQDESEADVVASAGMRGVITIATNLAGRGTDIPLGPGVCDLGGLHVIATDHQESSRLDRQLIGRCARQGDPGTAQIFLSADDELLVRHAPWLSQIIRKSPSRSGEVRTHVAHKIGQLQHQVESQRYQQRYQLLQDDLRRTRILEQIHECGSDIDRA